MNRFITFISVMAFCTITAQVGINTTTPDPSSALDILSTSKGVLLPRISNLSSVTNPATGLVIFDSNKKCISQNVGTPAAPDWICLSPYATKFFYMPSVVFDTTTTGAGQTKDLYTLYKNQFSNVPSNARSASAPASIPFFPNATDLYYYVTGFDSSVFKINSISSTGVLNYDVISNATSASFINIVFVVK
ncbi:hypothetical protein ACM46_06880 [Chryseobacterium angstadtii]|uniref:Uncharacterized protein n=1 Tax=Chryseobacterium angstadtii TaxID=558151 RepID=A0A0J7IHQ4_9FLAO|nr:hypothetical protein [Chryseobacterium angstadtii]KMQ65597.1 hypothetical protein ACM46_06880 [Chryseobacterium angstadtii]